MYTLRAQAKGFSVFKQQNVEIVAAQVRKLDITLQIAEEKQEVTVREEATRVGVSPQDNASTLVIKGDDLQALSDDPDELQSELEALAGPSAGPNGGQIYVDGFTAGQLPPKADILEIRINHNPFSAEYDRLGYGRIEITTRPGASKFHGQVLANLNDSAINSRNPFAGQEPGYHSEFFNGSVGGPLGKKAAFFFTFFRRQIEDNSVISAYVLSPTLTQTPLSQAVATPATRTNLSPRFDYQLGANNVLTVRYQFFDNNLRNGGVGQFSLPTQAFNTHSLEHTVQVSDTQVFSARTLNQFRFQYLHDDASQTAQFVGEPSLSVSGAFTGGDNSSGISDDTQNHYELQNLTSLFFGKHTLVVGGRLRDTQDANISDANFNGTFTFPSLAAYQAAEQALQACGNKCEVSGATQFSIVTGRKLIDVNLFDVGLFAQDDWQLHANMTLSLGVRWESQNDISDHSDFAPRVGFAWGFRRGPKGPPKTVLRAGFGMFYDRFGYGSVLQAERYNGINQQTYIIPSPNFYPVIPPLSTLPSLSTYLPASYQIAPNLRAPYTEQEALSLEQQATKNATLTLTYLHSQGVHQFILNDINAPLPGTFPLGDPEVGVRPFGNSLGNLYQYQSIGLFTQNQLIASVNMRLGTKLSVNSYYSLSYADSDSTGSSASVAMNPYNILENYGRASFDVRNRFFLSGNWNLPRRFSLSPFLVANTGAPFNVTIPELDLFGTAFYNDRPTFAAAGATGPNIVATRLGTFNIAPQAGQPLIPVNYFTGPGQLTVNLRLSKTFSFGKEAAARRTFPGGGGGGGGFGGGGRGGGGGGPRGGGGGFAGGGGGGGFFGPGGAANTKRYNLTFSVYARNLLNNVNPGSPIGVIGSRFFDQSNSLGGIFGGGGGGQAMNRRVDFQAVFSF
jgi:hypothetical protein